jgi:methylated-DNA-[protein]-cysteine S-methyltransferase
MNESNDEIYFGSLKTRGLNVFVYTDGSYVIKTTIDKKVTTHKNLSCIELPKNDARLLGALEQLHEYFENKRTSFDLPLRISGTDFQMNVWNELKKIPYGKVVSYKYIAEQLGDGKAVRAIGNANGANPVPIIIPCHRVINSNGSMGGYSGGGVDVKIKLLRLEGYLESELFTD